MVEFAFLCVVCERGARSVNVVAKALTDIDSE